MLNNTIERLRAMKMNAFASELERQIEDSESARIQTYENAIKRVQTEKQNLSTDKSGKKVAFNAAIKQIKQKNAKHDLLLYGKEYRGNMT